MNSRPPKIRETQRDFWPAMAFLLPNFLGFAIFLAFPVLYSLAVSFTNYDLQNTIPFHWTGLENFRELARDQKFWLCFINTVYMMLGIPVSIAGSLLLAVLLTRRLRFMVGYRTLFYLPTFTAGIAIMILWKKLYNPEVGPINETLRWMFDMVGLGRVELPQWLLSTRNLIGVEVERVTLSLRQWGIGARDAIMLMGVWIAIGGNNMLLYIAALSNIPPDLHEAAAIDGAGRWAQFRHVTWPQLAPTTFFITVMSFIGGLQGGFEQARVMTNGGPAGTTRTLAFYIFEKAFRELQIGYASAISWVLFIMIFAVTLAHWKFGSRELND